MRRPPDERGRERWRAARRGRPQHIEPAGPGRESVWDYPRPPRIEADARRVRVEHGGVRIADSRRALRVLETAGPPCFYLPRQDVRLDLLEPTARTTFCEWKGVARYWSLRVGGHFVAEAAWSYPEPEAGFESIASHLAFFAGRVDACWVDDERVSPQPGDFYGGWITPEIAGPFKGEPGSENW